MRNYKKEAEREKATVKRIVVKADKELAEAFTKKLVEQGETPQGHLKKYIAEYLKNN